LERKLLLAISRLGVNFFFYKNVLKKLRRLDMAGGKSTPKKDNAVKVSGGESVVKGQILVRGISRYKAGRNVKGRATLFALCPGKVLFTKKKIAHGAVKTFINVLV
jgi:ribosomal protein L27